MGQRVTQGPRTWDLLLQRSCPWPCVAVVLLVPSSHWLAAPTLTGQTAHTSLPCGQKNRVSQPQPKSPLLLLLPQVTLQGLPGERESGKQMAALPRPCALAKEIKMIPDLAMRPWPRGFQLCLCPTQKPTDVLLRTTRPKEHLTSSTPRPTRAGHGGIFRRIRNWDCFRIFLRLRPCALLEREENDDLQVILGDAPAEGRGMGREEDRLTEKATRPDRQGPNPWTLKSSPRWLLSHMMIPYGEISRSLISLPQPPKHKVSIQC